MTAADHERRFVLRQAASALARDAREAAGSTPAGSSEWHFFHGVQAAAEHVLRPEMAGVREGTAWLDAEEPSFRDGFLQAASLLGTSTTVSVPPMRIRLPEPPANKAGGR